MIVVDGRTDEEKLLELLAAGAEQTALDFKATLNLKNTDARLNFVKDALAMGNLPRGGYIVIGVRDDGTPAHDQDPLDFSHGAFDSARLRDHVSGWCEAPVNITSAHHTVDEREIVLVYVAPNPDHLPVPAAKTATLELPGGKSKVVFREGEVLMREGTQNVRLRYSHWHQLLGHYRDRVREEARRDTDALIRRVVETLGPVTNATAIPLDQAMDDETLARAVTVAFDANATAQVRRFVNTARAAAIEADAGSEEQADALNRLGLVGCQAVLNREQEVLDLVVDALWRVYDSAGDTPDAVRLAGTAAEPAKTLLAVLLRVFAIGSLVVREQQWEMLTALVLRRVQVATHYAYASWLWHGSVQAARAGLLQDEEGKSRGGLLLSLARSLVAERAALRPDHAADVALPSFTDLSPHDWLLNSLCEFDLWWCVIAATSAPASRHGGVFYPSCAGFHQYRSQPAIETIALDATARAEAFPDKSDKEVAAALETVIEEAVGQSHQFGGWWEGAEGDARVAAWLTENRD